MLDSTAFGERRCGLSYEGRLLLLQFLQACGSTTKFRVIDIAAVALIIDQYMKFHLTVSLKPILMREAATITQAAP